MRLLLLLLLILLLLLLHPWILHHLISASRYTNQSTLSDIQVDSLVLAALDFVLESVLGVVAFAVPAVQFD